MKALFNVDFTNLFPPLSTKGQHLEHLKSRDPIIKSYFGDGPNPPLIKFEFYCFSNTLIPRVHEVETNYTLCLNLQIRVCGHKAVCVVGLYH